MTPLLNIPGRLRRMASRWPSDSFLSPKLKEMEGRNLSGRKFSSNSVVETATENCLSEQGSDFYHSGLNNFRSESKQMKPAGVVSLKLSRILLEKGAVYPPPAWIKEFEPIVTQDPMTIRKYLGKESNSKRCVLIKCVPISTLAGSRTKSRNPSACTDCYQ
ncbi:hypothetical protein AVEN_167858-1 [Araneus ventricosus]|uniref:Uncharacterized protein n=1 Tax=Araneus ventricosus TaxID=182803 RepID=A0A4Y2W8R9_ARAVE|nr:hypothetical protein AVEN_248318-1 [Araneus ventricosus]GBO34062.1 hypothetical protein AVEN_275067-1 [Araneus ventricosus]GBO34063.1 hypothetical protein AVEN_22511-1 [Araneus ventricosus]GBO34067.1 hypothetical protein AVEN_167858-1 [Araneus ventricosus]